MVEVHIEDDHLRINNIGDQINVLANMLNSSQCTWYRVCQDVKHADDKVEKLGGWVFNQSVSLL